MTDRRIRTVLTEELEPEELAELTALCEAAFRLPFAAVWERVGAGVHVVADVAGRLVAHAMIIDRPLYVGHEADTAIDVGYVENVATLPEEQGKGHGAAAMERVGQVIGEEYALGALATTSHAFYERLGWERWSGPTSVRMPDGERVRSPKQDGHVMVLRTPRTPPDLRLDGAISIDWRAEESW